MSRWRTYLATQAQPTGQQQLPSPALQTPPPILPHDEATSSSALLPLSQHLAAPPDAAPPGPLQAPSAPPWHQPLAPKPLRRGRPMERDDPARSPPRKRRPPPPRPVKDSTRDSAALQTPPEPSSRPTQDSLPNASVPCRAGCSARQLGHPLPPPQLQPQAGALPGTAEPPKVPRPNIGVQGRAAY